MGFSGWLNYWRCEARRGDDDGVATGEMEMKDRLVWEEEVCEEEEAYSI